MVKEPDEQHRACRRTRLLATLDAHSAVMKTCRIPMDYGACQLSSAVPGLVATAFMPVTTISFAKVELDAYYLGSVAMGRGGGAYRVVTGWSCACWVLER